jgi:hypothetical protein
MVEATRKTKNAFRAKYMTSDGDQARAWLEFAQGKNDQAISLLRSVADKQDANGKGEVELPAQEMLADMLGEIGRTREALQEYGLYGAAHAAELSGEQGIAAGYLVAGELQVDRLLRVARARARTGAAGQELRGGSFCIRSEPRVIVL